MMSVFGKPSAERNRINTSYLSNGSNLVKNVVSGMMFFNPDETVGNDIEILSLM